MIPSLRIVRWLAPLFQLAVPLAAVAQSAGILPNPAFRNSTLACAISGVPSGTVTNIAYAWRVNLTKISATTNTLAPGPFVKQSRVGCTATFTNGGSVVATATSPDITISNSAPVVSSTILSPTTAFRTTTLQCTPTASDIDNDPITFSYGWSVNGTLLAGQTAATLAGAFAPGNTIKCMAAGNDGTAASSLVVSTPLTILADPTLTVNTAPTVSSVAPLAGPTAGGVSLTIGGSFASLAAPTVTVGGRACPVGLGNFSQSSITCSLPAGQGKQVPLVVTSGGVQSAPFGYSYAPPTVKSIAPADGPAAGGTTITITGTNLGTAASVTVGRNACRKTQQTHTSISCITPAGSQLVPVTVTVGGQVATNKPVFKYR